MIEVAFVGNPNVGKTALINAIAGSDLQVGNWPGVTVEKKEVTFTYEDETLHLVDLPGTYTLSPYTLEEKVTRSNLCAGGFDAIVNVVDTTDLRRNLYLTLELIDLQKPMVIALNMFDEFSKRGYRLDVEKLQEIFGIPCIPTIASKGIGTKTLLGRLYEVYKECQLPHLIPYQEHIEKEIAFLVHKMEGLECQIKRFLAIKLLENDSYAIQRMQELDPAIVDLAHKARERLQRHLRMDVKEFIVQDRYQKIDAILAQVLHKPLVDRVLLTDKIDTIALHRWFGIPLFFIVMFLMFKTTFDGSTPFVDWVGGFFDGFVAPHLRAAMADLPSWLVSLTVDGVVSGVGLVLSFLPLLAFLYFFMALLEESGYMARVSFLLDRVAGILGIKGNAFIALIVGFGCNVPAVYATRTLSSFRERLITALMIPFMSCSARLPVYALFTALFFTRHQALIIFSLYLLGILVAFIVGFIANKALPTSQAKPFFMELPTYHMPSARAIWMLMWPKLKDFIVRAGTVIVMASVILWGIINLPPSATPQTSYLAQISKKITPIFKPVGFGEHWEPVAALIPGTLAKEVIIGSLGTIYGVEAAHKPMAKSSILEDLTKELHTLWVATERSAHNLLAIQITSLETEVAPSRIQQRIRQQFTPLSALSYLVFILLYIPCVSTMAAIKNEFGWRWMLFETALLPILAYTVAFVVYHFAALLL